MAVSFHEMKIEDYDEIYALWINTDGMGISGADLKENVDRYLNRNPGGSFVAKANGKIVGTILCGHDGRRGYIYHLTIADDFRKQGIANRLVDLALEKLLEDGIVKCHVMVFADNISGVRYWEHNGWKNRTDITLVSKLFGIDDLDYSHSC